MSMAKNQTSTNSLGVCDKIYNAISVGPAFRKIRGIKHRPTNFNCPNISPSHGLPAPNPTAKVHVSADPPEKTMKPVPVRTVTGITEPMKTIAGQGQSQEGKVALKNSRHDDNDDDDNFSDYINRVKMKIRATSNVGGEKSAIRLNSFNDKVSNYINRAKIKIRSTSNVGGGKS